MRKIMGSNKSKLWKGTVMHLEKSRLLFIVRDTKGQVDAADVFLLEKMVSSFGFVKVYLCGDFCLQDSEQLIGRFCCEIEKRAYDCQDFQIIKEEVLLLSEDKSCEELVIVDNSVFGPFFEIDAILDAIRKKGYDFWGLTKMGEEVTETWEIHPSYPQMYFWGIEKRLLQSRDFEDFFGQRDNCPQFEEEFTSFFGQAGYRWGTYIDIPRFNSNSVTNNINLPYEIGYELVSQYNFPFLKRDYFIQKDLRNSTNADLHKIFGFIAEQQLYDTDIIWDFILKHYNIVQIRDSLNLNYILPVGQTENVTDITKEDCRDAVVVMHLAYEESLDEVQEYIVAIPDEIHKIFVVISEQGKQYLERKLLEIQYQNFEIRVMVPNRGRDMNSLFVVCRDVWKQYRYLCFAHDKRTSGDTGSFVIGKEFMSVLWENTLKSSGYILEVLALLKHEKRLGYLTVPAPYHSFYYETVAKAWAKSYEVTKDLAEKLQLDVEISDQFQPFALGNAFWCKTDALKDIVHYEFQTDDFSEEPMPRDGTVSHALERIMIFAAQNAGYYSGIIENAEYAGRELSNKNYMWEKLVGQILLEPQFCNTGTFSRLLRLVYDTSFQEFLKKRKQLYIWGAGKTGKGLNRELTKRGYHVSGYICSSGFQKPRDCDGKVYYLSEIDCSDPEVGIVLAVHKKFYKELLPVLGQLGDHVYYL
ncbi:MAG: hypothetical protein HFH73_05745 [Lachnospiraceae bacterium]|nr:hypothetical protein [Lachnospiraceae bacterium]